MTTENIARPSRPAPVIRRAVPADIPAIANVHIQAFPGFVLTKLGPRFLEKYYGAVLDYPHGILITAEVDGNVAGFAAGFCHPEGFARHLRSRTLSLLPALLSGLMRHPDILFIVAQNAFGVFSGRGVGPRHNPGEAEFASMGVLPTCQGMGIGKKLSHAFIEAARSGGALGIYLYTDAEGNDAVNAFHQSVGFQIRTTYMASGRRLRHEYFMPLS